MLFTNLHRNPPSHARTTSRGLGAVVALLVALAAGCEYQVIRETPKGGNILTKLGREGKLNIEDGSGNNAKERPAYRGYTIPLETYRGPDRLRKSHARIRELKEQAGLADLWTIDHEGVLRLYHGRFARENDPLASVALKQVRSLRINGNRPYKDAQIQPLDPRTGEATARDFNELNLRRFSDQGYLTLQIAVYDEAYGADFRKAAEQAAKALRDDGEHAFYYHGPHRSMVTVGLFTFQEHFVQEGKQRAYGPEIEKLQQKFPYNLVNGITAIQKNKEGQVIGEQESSVVRVP